MHCEWLKSEDGTVIHMKTTAPRKQECKFCHEMSRDMKLCDFPLGNGRTCDAQMCSNCARTLGSQETDIGNGFKKLNDTIDVCPIHRGMVAVEGGKIKFLEA